MIKNKKGYTIIEAVIAMLLVALIVSGVFSALMAARRTIAEPTYKEDMSFAMESVYNKLKASVNNSSAKPLCSGTGKNHPLDVGEHNISCLLPTQCTSGTFKYTISNVPFNISTGTSTSTNFNMPFVFFEASCARESQV